MTRFFLITTILLIAGSEAHAQGNQCRTATVGASTPNCASEAFVTDSIGAIPPPSGGTVTEQKNTFGYGLTGSGNCDNTSTNAASPCNALVALTRASNSLISDVTMNTNAYFPGPTMAQGATGTWFASGQVTVLDANGAATIACKLWDGTNIIDSASQTTNGANLFGVIPLSGFSVNNPPGNIRIDCADSNGSPNGRIKFNASGNSKDSTVSGFRIQ